MRVTVASTPSPPPPPTTSGNPPRHQPNRERRALAWPEPVERRILQLAASLAAGTTVSLRDTVTGLDDHNTARLLTAIRHATENYPATADTVNRS